MYILKELIYRAKIRYFISVKVTDWTVLFPQYILVQPPDRDPEVESKLDIGLKPSLYLIIQVLTIFNFRISFLRHLTPTPAADKKS
jgi:hypothetical protein